MFEFLRSFFGNTIPSTEKYEKHLNSIEHNYTQYISLKESDIIKRYQELKKYVDSPEYTKEINRIKALSYKGSQEQRKAKKFKSLKKDKDIKKYLKKGEETNYSKISEYLNLEKDINDPAFIKQVQYLKTKRRYKNSDPYLCKVEFKQLSKSQEVKEYFSLGKKYAKVFSDYELWVSKFYEDFSGSGLDTRRWETCSFWSRQLLEGKPYSPKNELQLALNKNISVGNSALKIHTLKESHRGMAWDKKVGFIPHEFNYTSGTVNTAAAFRQVYGKFEAKVKVNRTKGSRNIFWLGANQNSPRIEIFHFDGHKSTVSAYNEKNGIKQSVVQNLKLNLNNNEYYIYTLIWDERSLSWYINGKKIFESSSSMIDESLYLAFATVVLEEQNENKMPGIEIDWIKCFRDK